MRTVSIAAIATALIAMTSLSAGADQIITESFSVTIPNSPVPDALLPMAAFNSTPFPLFAPSIGTLKSVNIEVSGSVTVASLIADPDVGILLRGEGMILDNEIIHSATTTNLKLSGDDQDSVYIGTGNAVAVVLIGSGDNTPNASLIAGDGPLNGVVTYTYTPLTLVAVPETPTWAAMLVGFASLGFASRGAARKAAIRA
jgi:hypothetical protein